MKSRTASEPWMVGGELVATVPLAGAEVVTTPPPGAWVDGEPPGSVIFSHAA